ncbi:MAG TPA: AraC family transcriptional regulator [Hyphomonas atlantica]|nr:AraC family transcriptional regulator [Hyphomonas atlantica]
MSRKIGLLVFDDFQLLDMAGPTSVFEMPIRGMDPAPYEFTLYSRHGGSVRASCGVRVHTEPLAERMALDTLIISGGEGTRTAMHDGGLLTAIRSLSKRTRRTTSVCSGAFLLAAAGLLDGRKATTHWRRCPDLTRRFPNVQVQADRIYVRDDKFWTSAGISAGIDLALALVEDDLGEEVARKAARELVIHQRRHGGQSQFSVMQEVKLASGKFDSLISWIKTNLDSELTVDILAEKSRMSPRNFARVFKTETGTTPARLIEKLRLEAARDLVEGSTTSLQQIAQATGFREADRMRLSFLRAYGQPPMVLRRQRET